MAYEFHYTPTGTGAISGKEVLEQTEDAINDLGNTAISGVQEALDKAEQALTNSANAVDDAQTALNTANNAEGVAIQAQTDVGNLSGTVTNIGNRVTTAEGNISNLQGRMTTAEGNIGNLQGRMTTAEGNIGNLQTAVSTAQATANSAQQTANTARVQSYVFRYSSTALTASSTNSNTLLDNTDNLKVGDKVIDSSGVLFSVTAIDTQNSTFTIGTALIDLAQDSDVVHKSGDETISGDKVFNNRLIKNIDVVLGTAPSTGKFSNIDIADNNKSGLAQIIGGVYDTGNSYARFFVQNKTADDGTGLSPTGTIRACGFNINLPASSTSEGQGSITPRANKTTDFGLLSYQWRNLWCEKLFLNGTQLDPSAFVTTDTNQTISGEKTFRSDLTVANTDTTANTPNLNLRNYKADRGTVETSVQTIMFSDKNAKALTLLESRRVSNGNTSTNILCYNTDDNNNTVSGGVSVIKTKTATNFAPNADNTVTCGRPLAKWSDVQTYQINGLTPSSLSLPATRDNAIDISSYFTNFNNGDINQYAPTVNGWIYLETTGCNALHCFCTTTGNLVHYGNTVARSGDGLAYITFPVLAGTLFKCTWYTNSTITLNKAWFIPCQGNV